MTTSVIASDKGAKGKEIVSTKSTQQPSPFANFTFGGSSSKSFSELFSNLNANKAEFVVTAAQSSTSSVAQNEIVSTQNEDEVENFEPNVHFEPVIPLPDLVDAKTGEEDEDVVFSHRAKLLRFDTSAREWKDRGVGAMKVLVSKLDATKSRLLMRREQVLKICCNMPITKELKFSARNSTAASFGGQDFSEGEMRTETLTIKFKTAELLKNFQDAVIDLQKTIEENPAIPAVTAVTAPEKKVEVKKEKSKGFGDAFKPKAGSWSCEACYISNKADSLYCVACESPKDSTVPKKESLAVKSVLAPAPDAPKFSFGMPASGGFSFGMPASIPPSTSTVAQPQSSSITFGTASNTNTGFSFGSNLSSSTTSTVTPVLSGGGGFSFGNPNATVTSTSTSESQVSSTITAYDDRYEDDDDDEDLASYALVRQYAFREFKPASSPVLSPVSTPTTATITSITSTTATSNELGKTDSGFNFIFKKKSPAKSRNDSVNSEGGGDESVENEYHEEEENQTYFAPVIPLPDKIEVKTGEEDEVLLYSHRSKLYRFADTKEWKERGVGDIKILRHKETERLR